MTPSRRRFLRLAGAAAVLPAARSCPRAILPGAASASDRRLPGRQRARYHRAAAGQHLSKRLGQQFVIENRPGAASNIGTEYVAKAAPDGYTILMPVSTNTVNAALYRNLNFDFIRDIAPIAGIARTAFAVTVPASFPPATLSEFIAYLKAHPGKVNMGSAGIGGVQHVSGELFQLMTGTKMLHVPIAAISCRICSPDRCRSSGFRSRRRCRCPRRQAAGAGGDHHAAGRRAAGRAGHRRACKGYESSGWYGLGAPAKTPREITSKLADAMIETLADPAVKERLSQLGFDPMPLASDAFAKYVAAEVDKWSQGDQGPGHPGELISSGSPDERPNAATSGEPPMDFEPSAASPGCRSAHPGYATFRYTSKVLYSPTRATGRSFSHCAMTGLASRTRRSPCRKGYAHQDVSCR